MGFFLVLHLNIAPSVDIHLFGAYLRTMITRLKTEYAPLSQRSPTKIQRLFVGTPDLHRRCNRLLQVAARKVSAEPKVQRLLRAKCVNRVALDEYLSRHGRKCASAEFLPSGPPPKVFSAGRIVQGFQWVPFSAWLCECDTKNFGIRIALVPHFGSTSLHSARGRKARREGGGTTFPACLRSLLFFQSRDIKV